MYKVSHITGIDGDSLAKAVAAFLDQVATLQLISVSFVSDVSAFVVYK